MNAILTVILEDSQRNEVDRIVWTGNTSFLNDDDPSLGLINDIDFCSYDVFAQSDMAEIIAGLLRIRSKLDDNEAHLFNSVIALAQRCAAIDRSTLTFTPFGE